MFTRSTSTASVGNAPTNRRAFRDVSNNARNTANGKGKSAVPAKRANGIKTRSMSLTNGEVLVAPAQRKPEDDKPKRDPNYRSARERATPGSYQLTGNVDDIDERDKDDPLCATAYVADMYEYFATKESRTSVRPTYMTSQPHINERMRGILIDWLVEVHLKFKLVPETLYLTCNLIDRYLQREEVTRPKLQLVGVTCLLIASKYEEIYPPEIRDLVYICDRAYTKQDIIEMEEKVLKTLEYNITVPSSHCFLVRALKAGHADKRIVQMSCYILDSTLLSYQLLMYLPSQLAAASVMIARHHAGRNMWSPSLLLATDLCQEDIMPVARAILDSPAFSGVSELKAVAKKYASTRYGGVSNVTLSIDF